MGRLRVFHEIFDRDPAHALDLYIRLVRQNDGKLSRTKRASHFDWMTDEEVERFEAIVAEAFAPGLAAGR